MYWKADKREGVRGWMRPIANRHVDQTDIPFCPLVFSPHHFMPCHAMREPTLPRHDFHLYRFDSDMYLRVRIQRWEVRNRWRRWSPTLACVLSSIKVAVKRWRNCGRRFSSRKFQVHHFVDLLFLLSPLLEPLRVAWCISASMEIISAIGLTRKEGKEKLAILFLRVYTMTDAHCYCFSIFLMRVFTRSGYLGFGFRIEKRSVRCISSNITTWTFIAVYDKITSLRLLFRRNATNCSHY